MTEQTHNTCTATVTLAPGAETTALLRVVSVLHRRGVEVQQLTFRCDGDRAAVTARVSLGNTGGRVLEASLQRLVETRDAVVVPVRHSGESPCAEDPPTSRTRPAGAPSLATSALPVPVLLADRQPR